MVRSQSSVVCRASSVHAYSDLASDELPEIAGGGPASVYRAAPTGRSVSNVMTYCCGILVRDGLVMFADTRTNAGVDNIATFRKLHVFTRPGQRIMAIDRKSVV